jgi:putative SOS response-associated peptidase YedK
MQTKTKIKIKIKMRMKIKMEGRERFMCARFVLKKAKQDLESFFDLKLSVDVPPRYNIAPTQAVLVIRQEATGRRGAMLTWGLVPHWAKDPSIGN